MKTQDIKRLEELREKVLNNGLNTEERADFKRINRISQREHLKICKSGNFPNSKTAREYFEVEK